MPLVTIKSELERATVGKYALPMFDAFDMQSTDAMFEAAVERKAPVMVALYQAPFMQPSGVAFAAYIRERAKTCPVPVSLILDHGNGFEQCMKAIYAGFTDVMFDGSALPVEENIAITKQVVAAAHAVGVAVEAELGHVGRGDDYEDHETRRRNFTDPDMVERFIAETDVDYLAIAIGTAHGIPKGGDPEIDVDLLREIRSRVDIPLVMHGGSGCTEAQFRAVVANGISKINIATDLYRTAGRAVVEAAAGESPSYHALNGAARASFVERCGYYFDLFGTSGKA